eukprot:TRINITY_DN1612_c0_g1_i3.p1 TRINITY_DN1612_c0_g1~~TRINITY_DN1612_c0_g1_i3.p1  ORF type:complete len:911 (+),score=225.55 TRINITY_DN1612_c0_g1_i3:162-2894(+)
MISGGRRTKKDDWGKKDDQWGRKDDQWGRNQRNSVDNRGGGNWGRSPAPPLPPPTAVPYVGQSFVSRSEVEKIAKMAKVEAYADQWKKEQEIKAKLEKEMEQKLASEKARLAEEHAKVSEIAVLQKELLSRIDEKMDDKVDDALCDAAAPVDGVDDFDAPEEIAVIAGNFEDASPMGTVLRWFRLNPYKGPTGDAGDMDFTLSGGHSLTLLAAQNSSIATEFDAITAPRGRAPRLPSSSHTPRALDLSWWGGDKGLHAVEYAPCNADVLAVLTRNEAHACRTCVSSACITLMTVKVTDSGDASIGSVSAFRPARTSQAAKGSERVLGAVSSMSWWAQNVNKKAGLVAYTCELHDRDGVKKPETFLACSVIDLPAGEFDGETLPCKFTPCVGTELAGRFTSCAWVQPFAGGEDSVKCRMVASGVHRGTHAVVVTALVPMTGMQKGQVMVVTEVINCGSIPRNDLWVSTAAQAGREYNGVKHCFFTARATDEKGTCSARVNKDECKTPALSGMWYPPTFDTPVFGGVNGEILGFTTDGHGDECVASIASRGLLGYSTQYKVDMAVGYEVNEGTRVYWVTAAGLLLGATLPERPYCAYAESVAEAGTSGAVATETVAWMDREEDGTLRVWTGDALPAALTEEKEPDVAGMTVPKEETVWEAEAPGALAQAAEDEDMPAEHPEDEGIAAVNDEAGAEDATAEAKDEVKKETAEDMVEEGAALEEVAEAKDEEKKETAEDMVEEGAAEEEIAEEKDEEKKETAEDMVEEGAAEEEIAEEKEEEKKETAEDMVEEGAAEERGEEAMDDVAMPPAEEKEDFGALVEMVPVLPEVKAERMEVEQMGEEEWEEAVNVETATSKALQRLERGEALTGQMLLSCRKGSLAMTDAARSFVLLLEVPLPRTIEKAPKEAEVTL